MYFLLEIHIHIMLSSSLATLPYLCKSRWILSPSIFYCYCREWLLTLFVYLWFCYLYYFLLFLFLVFLLFIFACDKDNNRITDKIRIRRINVFSFSVRIGYGLALRSLSLSLSLPVCVSSRVLFLQFSFRPASFVGSHFFSCLPFVCYLFSQRKCYKLLKRLRFVQLVCYHIPTHIHICM